MGAQHFRRRVTISALSITEWVPNSSLAYVSQNLPLSRNHQVPRAPLPFPGVTCSGGTSLSHQRALPLLHRSYGLMRQAPILPPPRLSPRLVGLCQLSPAPAGWWPFPTLSL